MKEKLRKSLIRLMTKFIQFLCDHEKCTKKVEKSALHALNGQTVYVVCDRCEKVVKTY